MAMQKRKKHEVILLADLQSHEKPVLLLESGLFFVVLLDSAGVIRV